MDDIALRPAIVPCTDRPRHQGRHRDRQTDRYRRREKQDRAGITDRSRQFGFAEQTQKIKVDQIDDEQRHQPRHRGEGHHRDMPKHRALGELSLCHLTPPILL